MFPPICFRFVERADIFKVNLPCVTEIFEDITDMLRKTSLFSSDQIICFAVSAASALVVSQYGGE
jgi:hypothetical protein